MAIATINPATGETLKTFEPLSEEALEEKLARAAAAWQQYRLTTPEQRVGWLRAAADVLDADADAVAELMTTEMGKTLASAKAEVAQVRQGAALLRRARPGATWSAEPYDADAVKAPRTPTSSTSRSAWCWRSCRGTSRSGRRCASPPRR